MLEDTARSVAAPSTSSISGAISARRSSRVSLGRLPCCCSALGSIPRSRIEAFQCVLVADVSSFYGLFEYFLALALRIQVDFALYFLVVTRDHVFFHHVTFPDLDRVEPNTLGII